MKWLLYNALFAVAYAVMVPSFLLRMKRRGGYRARFADRFGRYPKEVLSALCLVPSEKCLVPSAECLGETETAETQLSVSAVFLSAKN